MHKQKDFDFLDVSDSSQAGGAPPYAPTSVQKFKGAQALDCQTQYCVTDDLILHPLLFPGAVNPYHQPSVFDQPEEIPIPAEIQ
eukprot:2146633-Rhodomonas_salina.2